LYYRYLSAETTVACEKNIVIKTEIFSYINTILGTSNGGILIMNNCVITI